MWETCPISSAAAHFSALRSLGIVVDSVLGKHPLGRIIGGSMEVCVNAMCIYCETRVNCRQ